jgi:hypothetical protein
VFESYFIGVDLGRVQDFTAIAVVERSVSKGEFSSALWTWRKATQFQLRHLERVPIGTPYPEVVKRVEGITRSSKLTGPIHLAVDNTGVGAPVVDLLRDARPNGILMPVTITGGNSESSNNGAYCVPKRDLIIGLQVLLQRGGLQIAAGLRDGPALISELMGMQVKVSAAGNEQYGAWREGTHDDLVLAVALAWWAAGKAYPMRGGREEWWANPYEEEMIREFKRKLQKTR